MKPPLLFSLLFLLLLGGCRKNQTIKAVKVVPLPVQSTVSATSAGTVKAEADAALAFGVSGRIGRIRVSVGSHVLRGMILAELENSDLERIHRDSIAELKRLESLRAQGLATPAGLEDAQRAVEIARANLDKTRIRAPFGGTVIELNFTPGELWQMGGARPVLRIIDGNRLIRAEIDEQDIGKILVGHAASVRISSVKKKEFSATVRRIFPFVKNIREQDRTCEIELELEGASPSIPVGASAEVEIITSKKESTLAIPTRAILKTGTQQYVYRLAKEITKSAQLRRIPIETGLGNYERMEVLSGLREGELIAVPMNGTELRDEESVRAEVIAWP